MADRTASPIYKYDVLTQNRIPVLLVYGTTDCHHLIWDSRRPCYGDFYRRVIDAYRAENPLVKVFMLTSPYADAATHAANLVELTAMQRQLAVAWGLPCIDVYEVTRRFVME